MDGVEVVGVDLAGDVGPLVGGEDVEVRVPLRAHERAEVADPRLVDVLEAAEVVQQLPSGVAVAAPGAPDPQRPAGLVVVPGDDAAAADRPERVARREDAGGLGGAALGVDERDGPRAVEVLLDGDPVVGVLALGGTHPGLTSPPVILRRPPRQPQVAGPRSCWPARRSRKSVADMKPAHLGLPGSTEGTVAGGGGVARPAGTADGGGAVGRGPNAAPASLPGPAAASAGDSRGRRGAAGVDRGASVSGSASGCVSGSRGGAGLLPSAAYAASSSGV